MRTRRWLQVGAVVLVLAATGGGIAAGITSALGIRVEAKDVPVERLHAAPPREAVAPPKVVRVDAADSVRMQAALAELTDATSDATDGRTTLVVRHGDGDRDDDSYRLGGTPERLRITAAQRDRRGPRHLRPRRRRCATDAVVHRAPRRDDHLGAALPHGRPRRGRRRSVDDDSLRGGHRLLALLARLRGRHPPRRALHRRGRARRCPRRASIEYVHHVLAAGLQRDRHPRLPRVRDLRRSSASTPSDRDHVARAQAMREAFGPLWQSAHDMGMNVYFRTDMLAADARRSSSTSPTASAASTPRDPELWQVYEAGLDELYDAMPYVDGRADPHRRGRQRLQPARLGLLLEISAPRPSRRSGRC